MATVGLIWPRSIRVTVDGDTPVAVARSRADMQARSRADRTIVAASITSVAYTQRSSLDGLAVSARAGGLDTVPGVAEAGIDVERLSAAADGAPIVHTDDFASADNPVDWWPRLLAEVIEPLSLGDCGRYQRYDWSTNTLAEWCTVERDGPSRVDQWESWMAAEDAHFARDPVRERADVIVDGRRQQDRERLPYVDPGRLREDIDHIIDPAL